MRWRQVANNHSGTLAMTVKRTAVVLAVVVWAVELAALLLREARASTAAASAPTPSGTNSHTNLPPETRGVWLHGFLTAKSGGGRTLQRSRVRCARPSESRSERGAAALSCRPASSKRSESLRGEPAAQVRRRVAGASSKTQKAGRSAVLEQREEQKSSTSTGGKRHRFDAARDVCIG